MRSKLVNETLSDFKRGLNPRESLNIGKKAQIESFFNELEIDRSRYEIDDEFNTFFKGSLNLWGTSITQLPDNLSVERNLNLMGTSITELPYNLRVRGEIYKDF